MSSISPLSFRTLTELSKWMRANHSSAPELWVRIFKKGSGLPTVDWNDCVVAALAWGWIDGQRKPLDSTSFLQRLSPRRPKSTWSKRNCAIAERLIAEGRMRPSGLAHVEAARADGRWERAYAGSAKMVMPEDFLEALNKSSAAKKLFATLDRRNRFAIYHRLQTCRRVETRNRRIASIVNQLARGETFD